MLPQLAQYPSNNLYILFALALSVDEDVIEIHYHKNVKLLGQDLVDITLKRGQYIGQSEKYNLVLKMAIVGPESRLPFVSFPNPLLMVGIDQIKLSETLSPIQSIQ